MTDETVPVTVDNFVRAETDTYLHGFAGLGLGVFLHRREPAPIDHQDVVRMNRDTLYSIAIVDLDAGPATVTLPETGGRFMSLQVISQAHFSRPAVYAPCTHQVTRDSVGTRYAALLVRTLVDPLDAADLAAVAVAQDAIALTAADAGPLELPSWDPVSLGVVRDTLKRVAPSVMKGPGHMFGTAAEVDAIKHLVGTAIGWGGNPEADATYVGAFPERNDGTTAYRLVVRDVPVDGFWSISVYDEAGFFVANADAAYTVNSVTATPDADGGVTVQFGGSRDGAANWIAIMPGWNYVVRLYRPRPEILDGSWKFPVAHPV